MKLLADELQNHKIYQPGFSFINVNAVMAAVALRAGKEAEKQYPWPDNLWNKNSLMILSVFQF